MAVFLAMMMLGGCGASEGERQAPAPQVEPIKIAIPRLLPADKKHCSDPGVPVGVEVREILADTRVALADCTQKHQRVVRQYRAIENL